MAGASVSVYKMRKNEQSKNFSRETGSLVIHSLFRYSISSVLLLEKTGNSRKSNTAATRNLFQQFPNCSNIVRTFSILLFCSSFLVAVKAEKISRSVKLTVLHFKHVQGQCSVPLTFKANNTGEISSLQDGGMRRSGLRRLAATQQAEICTSYLAKQKIIHQSNITGLIFQTYKTSVKYSLVYGSQSFHRIQGCKFFLLQFSLFYYHPAPLFCSRMVPSCFT